MAQRIAKSLIQKRFYASIAAKAKVNLSAPEVQVSKASNGVTIVAQQTDSSIARVVCAVKAGSRYEDAHEKGVAHCLRVISDHTQKEARSFGMTRDLHQMGATICCTNTRDHLIYTLEVPSNLISFAMPYLTGMAHPSLRPWEISDRMPRLEYELLALTEQPDKRVVERAHEAAYRETGLGRSLFAPVYQLTEFSDERLQGFLNKTFTPERIVLSATGVSMSDLSAAAAKFNMPSAAASDVPSKYYGGEIRDSSEDLIAHSIIAGPAASSSSDEFWAYSVLEQLLGAGPRVKWASNMTSNPLNSNVSKLTQDPFHIQAFNIGYSDSGLFGVSVVAVPENSEIVLRSAMEQLRSAATSLPSQEALQGAKNRVKSTVAFQAECQSEVALSCAVEMLNAGKLTALKDTMAAIDKVQASTVQNAAKKLVESKLTMASVGELRNVPYIDQL